MSNAISTFLANSFWFASCLPDATMFHLATRNVKRTQRALLEKLLRENADTEFGRRHHFASIRSLEDFRERVPLSTYDDYREAIEQMTNGAANVLTAHRVTLFEPTSGSSAPTKLIPYTASLKREFNRGIAPWIANLYAHNPALFFGKSYWSVSPAAQRSTRTAGGTPIGFEDDAQYLGGVQQFLSRSVLAAPSSLRSIQDMEQFRHQTLLHLLECRSLGLISVWNPSFLLLLMESLAKKWLPLTCQICNRRRAAEVREIFQSETDSAVIHTRLWPHLKVISCWTDAFAARHAAEVQRLFPQARLQGKGLIATEGFISFPMCSRERQRVDKNVHRPLAHARSYPDETPALSIRSHFFEFLSENGTIRLAHELEEDATYSVVLTTSGGLYRYQLHDRIQVVGHHRQCPLIRFVGKEAHVSDRFGEKLNEQHVQRALGESLQQARLNPSFTLMSCEEFDGRFAYTLFVETSETSDERLAILADALEMQLQENFHYRYCRDLGQLEALRVFRIESGGLETFLAESQRKGQRLGDVKPLLLSRHDGWTQAFRGRLVSLSSSQICSR